MPKTSKKPMPPGPRLGKRPPQHDVRTLELGDYLFAPALVGKVPPAWDWSAKVASWPMLGNDKAGDCVEADMGHQEQLWSAADGGGSYVPTEAETLLVYSQIAHYDPNDPATDTGTILLQAMNFWRTYGFSGRKIDAYCSFPQHGPKKIQQAIYLFGGVTIGLALPRSAQSQVNTGQPWTVVPGPDGAIGSWGGHAVPLFGYAPDGLTCVTWGRVQKMDWPFFARYCDEAYAPLSRDWTGPDGLAPNALNWGQLRVDLAALRV